MDDTEIINKLKQKAEEPKQVIHYHNQVIKRVLHTRTEINIYPNGQCFQSSKTWFEDKIYEVKPKEKKQPKEVAQTTIASSEEY
jgi:hypothetical protein